MFLTRIPLHAPFRVAQCIVIETKDCMFEITKREKGLQIELVTSCEGKLVITINDVKSFQFLFGSKDLVEYGNRLVNLSTQGNITMDPGPYEDPMKSGFHRFIGYRKKAKGVETFRLIIPTF
ncbi:MAG: hypothetical protein HWN66_04200 [Candidatus Helarchaeota archaeon]|nr:hypothetical protein [Candidatus Helarchaeota archaeon]